MPCADESVRENATVVKVTVQTRIILSRGKWKKMSNEQQKSSKQRTSLEIITRVRKLRWAGMDEEAEQLLKEPEPQPAASAAAQSVIPTRLETD